jgi:MFS family permease
MSYRGIFRVPGALAFTMAGLLARISMSMFGVSVIFMIAATRHSYSLAGAISAAGLVTVAIGAPLMGRLVDRYGQARVAVPAVCISACASGLTVLCALDGAPVWTLFVTYMLSSAVPFVSSMARARWNQIFRDDPDGIHTANSFERVVDEACLILGPPLAALLSTSVSPEAGLIAATALLLIGTLRPDGPRPAPPLRTPGLKTIVLAFVFTGTLFGAVEVVTVAYAKAEGKPALAGLVLAAGGVSSCVTGFAFGTMRPRGTAVTRFLVCLTAMGVLAVPLLFVNSLLVAALCLVATGIASSPTMITIMTLVGDLTPPSQVNEGFALAEAGFIVGMSAGAALGGEAVQRLGAAAGYRVPVLAAGCAVVIGLAGARRLTRALRNRHQPPAPATSASAIVG